MFSEEGLKALQNARQNIENRRNSRKPLVVKPYGNYRDPEGKNGKWYYHDFVSQYDDEYTKKLKKKMKKNHESKENDPIINRYELYGKQYDQKIFENPRYKIDTSDHRKDYLNFDGEQVYFDTYGNPISQEEMEEAQNALRSLKQKHANQKNKSEIVKYNKYIDEDISTKYSNDSLFDDYNWKDISNEIPKDNEYSIDEDDIDLGF